MSKKRKRHGAEEVLKNLREARFNNVPDSLFEIPRDMGVRVHDPRKIK